MTDIRSIYLAHLNGVPYGLYDRRAQAILANVTESQSDPYSLGWFTSPDGLTAGLDVHQVLNYNGVPHLHVVGAHDLKRASVDASWITTDQIDYIGGCPMFPVNVNEGDAGEIQSSGKWDWTKYSNDGFSVVATGTGEWTYLSRWEYAFGRLHWEEIYSETHDDTGQTVPYHRIHSYDAQGWMGFIDRLNGQLAVRQDLLNS